MEEHGFVHKSVLLYETVGSLNIKPGGIYVDGTLGGGGHAYEVCKRLGGGRLIGIDQDADAIRAAGERLAPFKDKVTIVRSNYQNIENVLKELNIEKVADLSFSVKIYISNSNHIIFTLIFRNSNNFKIKCVLFVIKII
jgi:16S rRNA (cytosine1402-N4)-methyltransferase